MSFRGRRGGHSLLVDPSAPRDLPEPGGCCVASGHDRLLPVHRQSDTTQGQTTPATTASGSEGSHLLTKRQFCALFRSRPRHHCLRCSRLRRIAFNLYQSFFHIEILLTNLENHENHGKFLRIAEFFLFFFFLIVI